MSLVPYRKNNNMMYPFNPFRMMDDMEREFFGESRTGSFNTDIRDTGDAFVLEADLPGFRKEDINIDVSDGTLSITAERHSEHEDKDKKGNYIRCERAYGKFSRRFDTSGIDTGAVKAAFQDGVLTLTLPKLVEQPPVSRRLEIE